MDAPAPVLAVLLAVVQVVGTRAATDHDAALDALGYALLIGGPLALAVRKRQPVVSLVLAVAAAAGYFAGDYPDGPTFVAAIVATFHAVKAGHSKAARNTVGLVVIGYALWTLVGPGTDSGRRVLTVAIWSAVMLFLAEASRVRAAHFAEMARVRAEQRRAEAEQERAKAEQERAKQEQQRRQASEERLRIARELHDVLGHHLSLINVQAGVGLHLMDERPEQARAALSAIKHASAEALRETRAVLAALNPTGETAPRTPNPGLADLAALVDELTAAGLPVTAEVLGEVAPLPAEVDRAAYRIVQEALTNVRRHAGAAARATVLISYDESQLQLTVIDDGTSTVDESAGEPVDGNGLAGMRQRAGALGGELAAGRRPGGGFEVRATLPFGQRQGDT